MPAFERLILASASPRRADLLHAAGFAFDVLPSAADESVHAGEDPASYVQRVALAKASAIVRQVTGRTILAADTAVVVDGLILGKPADAEDAARMLGRLSGRAHQVLTGVALAHDGVRVELESTTVVFAPLSEAEIAWYLASREWDDKAGAYAVQGLAARFVTRLEGSYSNVVGLPIARVYQMLRAAGVATGP